MYSVNRKLLGALFLVLGAALYAQNAGRANFGNYPADYGIAYMREAGFPKTPTVRELFGPNAAFVSAFRGIPCSVTLESSSGTASEFSAQILIKIQNRQTGEMVNTVRILARFQANSTAEKSYVRYTAFTNIASGKITEDRSYGSTTDDGYLAGTFTGYVNEFWDVAKYKPPPTKAELEREQKRKAEEERVAKEEAERQEKARIAREEAERERVAKQEAERQERDRIAKEKAEAERQEAERQRIIKEFPRQLGVAATLFSAQDFNSAAVTKLAAGSPVKLEEYGEYTDVDGETAKWARVTTPDGKTGWVFSGYLQ